MRVRTERRWAMLVAFAVALACGGTEDPGDEASGNLDEAANAASRKGGTRFTVGGTLSGLSGDAVTLQDNGSYDTLTLGANGTFTFAKPLKNRSAYAVTVLTQPSGQTCTVANGTGTITSNVTNVTVSCSPNPSPVTYYTVGGTTSGLSGTFTLQDNGGDNLMLSTDGSFTFATALADGSSYTVTVATQPSGQTCTVANGTGAISGANVTNVAVSCSPNASSTTYYTVGGSVSGFTGTLVLQDNGSDNLTLTADGSFVFTTPLPDGSSYTVTVATQPSGQTCGFGPYGTDSSASGTISGANVSGTVRCFDSFPGYYAYQGYCFVDPATSTETGDCMDLATCAIGASTFCALGGAINPPTVNAYCGPTLDYTLCWF